MHTQPPLVEPPRLSGVAGTRSAHSCGGVIFGLHASPPRAASVCLPACSLLFALCSGLLFALACSLLFALCSGLLFALCHALEAFRRMQLLRAEMEPSFITCQGKGTWVGGGGLGPSTRTHVDTHALPHTRTGWAYRGRAHAGLDAGEGVRGPGQLHVHVLRKARPLRRHVT